VIQNEFVGINPVQPDGRKLWCTAAVSGIPVAVRQVFHANARSAVQFYCDEFILDVSYLAVVDAVEVLLRFDRNFVYLCSICGPRRRCHSSSCRSIFRLCGTRMLFDAIVVYLYVRAICA
jgi:hypothetical protein